MSSNLEQMKLSFQYALELLDEQLLTDQMNTAEYLTQKQNIINEYNVFLQIE